MKGKGKGKRPIDLVYKPITSHLHALFATMQSKKDKTKGPAAAAVGGGGGGGGGDDDLDPLYHQYVSMGQFNSRSGMLEVIPFSLPLPLPFISLSSSSHC